MPPRCVLGWPPRCVLGWPPPPRPYVPPAATGCYRLLPAATGCYRLCLDCIRRSTVQRAVPPTMLFLKPMIAQVPNCDAKMVLFLGPSLLEAMKNDYRSYNPYSKVYKLKEALKNITVGEVPENHFAWLNVGSDFQVVQYEGRPVTIPPGFALVFEVQLGVSLQHTVVLHDTMKGDKVVVVVPTLG